MKNEKIFYVYMLASNKNGTLYIGVTNNLLNRISQHKKGVTDGFTKKYRVYLLVYYEIYHDSITAISREKQLKHWNREWKIKLIEENNPGWNDLYEEVLKAYE